MTGTAKVLRNTGFSMMVVFGVVGGLFVAGYAFEDLSLWPAIGSTAAWALPAIGLCVLALTAERVGPPTFVVLTAVVAALTILDSTLTLVDRDAVGPVAAIGVFALGTSLGFLGLRRTSLAGLLLVVLGVAQLVATVAGFAGEYSEGAGPGPAHLLTTSSGVVVMPLLLVGVIFLVSGAMSHDTVRAWHLRPPRVAH